MVDIQVNTTEVAVTPDAIDQVITVSGDLSNFQGLDVEAHTRMRTSTSQADQVIYDVAMITSGSVSGVDQDLLYASVSVPAQIDNSNPIIIENAYSWSDTLSFFGELIVKRRDNHGGDFHFDTFLVTTSGGIKLDLYVFRFTEDPGKFVTPVSIPFGLVRAHTLIRTVAQGQTVWNLFIAVRQS